MTMRGYDTGARYLVLNEATSGYPFGVAAESDQCTELHGPFATELAATDYANVLLKEYADYSLVTLVKIETPHFKTITRPESREISAMQEMEFDRIMRSSFNDFDGPAVVQLLRQRRDLWEGVVMDRAGYVSVPEGTSIGYASAIDLIKLRDIGANYWNVDTLFITPAVGKKSELEVYVRAHFGADEVDYFEDRNAGTVLRVWFD